MWNMEGQHLCLTSRCLLVFILTAAQGRSDPSYDSFRTRHLLLLQRGAPCAPNPFNQPMQQDPFSANQQQQNQCAQNAPQPVSCLPVPLSQGGQTHNGYLPQNILDQVRAYIGNTAPIFILPNNSTSPPQQLQMPQQSLPMGGPPTMSMCYSPGAYTPMSVGYPAPPPVFCPPPAPCYPYPFALPVYDPFGAQNRFREKSNSCSCCQRRSSSQAGTLRNSGTSCCYAREDKDEHQCSEGDDDAICTKKNCPSSTNLQALASQFLSIQGIIPCAATRIILKRVPGSNISTTMEETIDRAQKSINRLNQDQLLTEARNAQQVNALINLHLTASPPTKIIPILTLLQLKVNVLKAHVESLINRKLTECQGVGADVNTTLDPMLLSMKSDNDLRELLCTLRQKECEERVNVNFAPYHSQRVIAESRLNSVQNKIGQVESEIDRRRTAAMPWTPMARMTDTGKMYELGAPNPPYPGALESFGNGSPSPFMVQVRNPRRLILKPCVGSSQTTYELSSEARKSKAAVCVTREACCCGEAACPGDCRENCAESEKCRCCGKACRTEGQKTCKEDADEDKKKLRAKNSEKDMEDSNGERVLTRFAGDSKNGGSVAKEGRGCVTKEQSETGSYESSESLRDAKESKSSSSLTKAPEKPDHKTKRAKSSWFAGDSKNGGSVAKGGRGCLTKEQSESGSHESAESLRDAKESKSSSSLMKDPEKPGHKTKRARSSRFAGDSKNGGSVAKEGRGCVTKEQSESGSHESSESLRDVKESKSSSSLTKDPEKPGHKTKRAKSSRFAGDSKNGGSVTKEGRGCLTKKQSESGSYEPSESLRDVKESKSSSSLTKDPEKPGHKTKRVRSSRFAGDSKNGGSVTKEGRGCLTKEQSESGSHESSESLRDVKESKSSSSLTKDPEKPGHKSKRAKSSRRTEKREEQGEEPPRSILKSEEVEENSKSHRVAILSKIHYNESPIDSRAHDQSRIEYNRPESLLNGKLHRIDRMNQPSITKDSYGIAGKMDDFDKLRDNVSGYTHKSNVSKTGASPSQERVSSGSKRDDFSVPNTKLMVKDSPSLQTEEQSTGNPRLSLSPIPNSGNLSPDFRIIENSLQTDEDVLGAMKGRFSTESNGGNYSEERGRNYGHDQDNSEEHQQKTHAQTKNLKTVNRNGKIVEERKKPYFEPTEPIVFHEEHSTEENSSDQQGMEEVWNFADNAIPRMLSSVSSYLVSFGSAISQFAASCSDSTKLLEEGKTEETNSLQHEEINPTGKDSLRTPLTDHYKNRRIDFECEKKMWRILRSKHCYSHGEEPGSNQSSVDSAFGLKYISHGSDGRNRERTRKAKEENGRTTFHKFSLARKTSDWKHSKRNKEIKDDMPASNPSIEKCALNANESRAGTDRNFNELRRVRHSIVGDPISGWNYVVIGKPMSSNGQTNERPCFQKPYKVHRNLIIRSHLRMPQVAQKENQTSTSEKIVDENAVSKIDKQKQSFLMLSCKNQSAMDEEEKSPEEVLRFEEIQESVTFVKDFEDGSMSLVAYSTQEQDSTVTSENEKEDFNKKESDHVVSTIFSDVCNDEKKKKKKRKQVSFKEESREVFEEEAPIENA